MYMTKREREMQHANNRGYAAYPFGRLPEEYREQGKEHLKKAWEGGWNIAEDENTFWNYFEY